MLTASRGSLIVDDKQMTNMAGLYAAGDVVSDFHQLSIAEGARRHSGNPYITTCQIIFAKMHRLNAANTDPPSV